MASKSYLFSCCLRQSGSASDQGISSASLSLGTSFLRTRISKEIQSISYERNTTVSQKEIFDKLSDMSENSLDIEDCMFICEDDEVLEAIDESEALANNELFDTLYAIYPKRKAETITNDIIANISNLIPRKM